MLTNYFSGKKRSDPFQPSKRRKVLRSTAKDEPKLSVAVFPDLKNFDFTDVTQKQNSEGLTPESSHSKLTLQPSESASKSRNRSTSSKNTSKTSKRPTRTRGGRQKSVTNGPMDKLLARAANKNNQSVETVKPQAELKEEPASSSGNEGSEDSEVTSVSDDHDLTISRSLPGTPTKRSQKDSEAPIRRKRRKPILSDETAPEDTDDAVSDKVTSTRQKRSASRSKASVKKSLDKTFQKYDNTQQSTNDNKTKEVSSKLPVRDISSLTQPALVLVS